MSAASSLPTATDRVLPTLEKDGSRRWLTPRLSMGRTWKLRRAAAYILIGIFAGVPFVRVGGKPAVLLDVARREFTLLGYTFLPRDTMLLALLLVTWILSIFLVTALVGRAWCGWTCPQTVYMEFLFRPIERLCMGRKGVGGKSKVRPAPWRYVAKYVLFLLASLFVAHTFLSYFVGVAELRQWVTRSPFAHPWPFAVMFTVTAAMMFDFAYFREQTCLIACPYGRFQSVLLDRNSLVVQYDRNRGEPRGKTVALKQVDVPKKGDCVDCRMCVQTCPTGIDIRDGVQFECINCAQCIDACDAVMDRLELPRNLIGYSSQAAAEGMPMRIIRPRVMVYAAAVIGLLAFVTVLIATKSPMDVLLLRNGGLPFVITPDGRVENTMRLQITNRGSAAEMFEISVEPSASIVLVEANQSVTLQAGESSTRAAHLLAESAAFSRGPVVATVRVKAKTSGAWLDRTCQLFGPAISPVEAKP